MTMFDHQTQYNCEKCRRFDKEWVWDQVRRDFESTDGKDKKYFVWPSYLSNDWVTHEGSLFMVPLMQIELSVRNFKQLSIGSSLKGWHFVLKIHSFSLLRLLLRISFITWHCGQFQMRNWRDLERLEQPSVHFFEKMHSMLVVHPKMAVSVLSVVVDGRQWQEMIVSWSLDCCCSSLPRKELLEVLEWQEQKKASSKMIVSEVHSNRPWPVRCFHSNWSWTKRCSTVRCFLKQSAKKERNRKGSSMRFLLVAEDVDSMQVVIASGSMEWQQENERPPSSNLTWHETLLSHDLLVLVQHVLGLRCLVQCLPMLGIRTQG